LSRRLVLVGTYPPRRCGLATFAAHLLDAVRGTGLIRDIEVLPVVEEGEGIRQKFLPDYREAARYVNSLPSVTVSLQHEFGIFGGPDGEYVLDFTAELQKPLVTTFHTVLAHPDERKRKIIRLLARKSQMVTVMARRGMEILTSVYGVEREKIAIIPHGVPDPPPITPREAKEMLGVEGRVVIATMGLLNPGKGIEYALEALPPVVEEFPEVIYLVVGETHPGVRRIHGESYRESLLGLVERLGLREHVRFVNSYLGQEELLCYLLATDIYVTPYLGREQITSGTLAYAVGMGKAVVSTPYYHAEELLGGGAGCLVDFRDPEGIARALLQLLRNPHRRHLCEARARMLGRSMRWSLLGSQYARLFLETMEAAPRTTVLRG